MGSVIVGLTAARLWSLAPGGTIVLTAVLAFAFTAAAAGVVRRVGAGPVLPG